MAVTFDAVRQIALSLGGVEEGTSYGTAAFKVSETLIARLREDGETLVVRVELDSREDMLVGDPETYYITDHYLKYPWILVRLSRIDRDSLRDLLTGAWRLAQASKVRKGRKGRGK